MEDLKTINDWEKEEQTPEPKYGCIMMDAKVDKWEDDHIGGIDPKDVYIKPYDDSYGLEDKPHVTILYGIHEEEIDPEVLLGVIQDDMEPVTVMIEEIGMFETPDYDVVKYDVPVTDQLKKYRNKFETSFSNTQDYPEYKPHVTLAYVKPGKGKKYAKKLEEPFEITFDKGVYSFHDEEGETKYKEHVFPKEDDFDVDLTISEWLKEEKL
jgi:2'-5' RNA ligase